MARGIVFQGRLIKIPGAYGYGEPADPVVVNPVALNVVALVGESLGGEPGKPMFFNLSGRDRALDYLRGGPLHTAARAAWAPSGDMPGADVIICVRTNAALKATATFDDTAAADAIKVSDRDWGVHGNGTQIAFLAGKGDPTLRRVGVRKMADAIDQISPDLGQVLKVSYTGDGTATIQVTQAAGVGTLTAVVTGATDGTTGFTFTLTDAGVNTIEKLANMIASLAGWNARVMGNAQMKSNWLDAMAAPAALEGVDPDGAGAQVAPKTPVTLLAINGACVDWINRFAVPAEAELLAWGVSVAVTGYQFLTGGAEGVSDIDAYKDAFAKLSTEPAYFIVPCTDDPLVVSAALEHVVAMRDVKVKRRRQLFAGHALADVTFAPNGQIDISVLADRIFTMNSFAASMFTPGIELEDEGEVKLFASWAFAAAAAGLKAGGKPQMSLTYKYIKCLGVQGNYDPLTEEMLIDAGASYLVKVPQRGFRIGMSQTAQLKSSVPFYCEPSMIHVADTILTDMELTLGEKYTGVPPERDLAIQLNRLKRDAERVFQEYVDDGALVGTDENPAFVITRVGFANQTWQVEAKAGIGEPGNYITILAGWTAVSGSVTA